MTLGWKDGPVITGMENVLFDRAFECIIMRGHDPTWIARGFDEFRRHWIAGGPQLDRVMIDGISNTKNLGSGVRCIAMYADSF